jgi:hypothetical protein
MPNNDCPTCQGRKIILTRDYQDCERDEPCPHCSEHEHCASCIALRAENARLRSRVEELENKTPLDRLTTFLETPIEEFEDEVPVCRCGAPSPDGVTCWKCLATQAESENARLRRRAKFWDTVEDWEEIACHMYDSDPLCQALRAAIKEQEG